MKTGTICITKKSVQQRSLRQVVLESKFVTGMARLFSAILGEKVTPLQAIKHANAQAAIASLLVLGGISPLVALVLLVWASVAMYQCKD